MSANNKVRVGALGVGNRGSYMARNFAENDDCDVLAVCDAFKPSRDKSAEELPGKVDAYADYKRVLERKDIDAVLIASPDHWHAQMMIEACQAGKDVYVEKPACRIIADGFKMIEASVKHKRVVQVGLQQRSWDHFVKCAEMVHAGKFGAIYNAGLHWQGSYNTPPEKSSDPPPELDWELFQGPAPRRPYTPIAPANVASFL